MNDIGSKSKIKILLFIDWFLPGTASGGPVRSIVNMMHHLKDFVEFKVITRNKDYVSNKEYDTVVSDSWNKIFKNVEVYYLSEKYINSKNLKRIIESIEFDSIYINGIYSYKFSILPLLLTKKYKIRTIVGARGMLNPQAFSVKKTKKRLFIWLANIYGLYSGIYFHATNNDEAEHIKSKISSYKKILIAPNLPRPLQNIDLKTRIKSKGELKLVCVARISKEKGILKMIKYVSMLQKGNIRLHLYGPIYDESYWSECMNEINKLPNTINVEYKGMIAGNLIPEVLKKYQFFMMPSEGENFGHSILEAMSSGLPVIISDRTPWKNLESIKVGWDLPLNNSKAFEHALTTCLEMSSDEYNIWSKSAFKYAKDFISNPEILEQNKKLFMV